MASSKILQNPDIAAYERIRSYVIGQMYKSGDSSMRLASCRELAKQFSVTPPTVLKALKELVAEGFLTVKPGIGTFTNPARMESVKGSRLIGCFSGDGRDVIMNRIYWQVFPPFMDALLKSSGLYKIQHSFVGADGLSPESVERLGLDGVVWFSPNQNLKPALRKIKESLKLPMLSICGSVPGVSSFYFDNEADNFMIASKMLDEGRRKILLMLPEEQDSSHAEPQPERGVERAFAERGLLFDRQWVFRDSQKERAFFARVLATLQPEGVIFNSYIPHCWPALKGSPALLKRCRVCTGAYPLNDDMGYVGWALLPELQPACAMAVENFKAQFESPAKAKVLNFPFSTKLVFENDLADKKGASTK